MEQALLIWVKIGGAAVGSSIAVVFKPGDPWRKLLQRFVIGVIFGVISAPIIRNFLGWPDEIDYWLAASALGGLTGYLALQILFSDAVHAAVNSRIGRGGNDKQ